MKIHEYNEMMSYLTRPAQPKNIKVADLVDDLTPGPLKDELTKDYDPSQETHEQYLQRKALEDERVRLAIGGGAFVGKELSNNREGFAGIQQVKNVKKMQLAFPDANVELGDWYYDVRNTDYKGPGKGDSPRLKIGPFKSKKKAQESFNKRMAEVAKIKKATLESGVLDQTIQINNFVKNFYDENATKFNLRDYESFKDFFLKAFKKSGIKDLGRRSTLHFGFPNVGKYASEGSKGKSGAPLTLYDVDARYASGGRRASDAEAFFKKAFYTAQIKNNPKLQQDLKKYLDYYNIDKKYYKGTKLDRAALRRQYADVLDPKVKSDLLFLLESDSVGTGKLRGSIIRNFFPKEFDAYVNKKGRAHLRYAELMNMIENSLTDKQLKKALNGETSIKKFMQKQTKELNKIFNTKKLIEAGYPELIFNADHLEGIAEIANMDSSEEKVRALKNLMGTTSERNRELGLGGFSTQRRLLINNIQKGINVKNNLKELNEITKMAYPEFKGDLYTYNPAIKNVVPTKNFRMEYEPEVAFKQYFTELTKSKVGLKELQKQYKNNPELQKIIQSDPDLFSKVDPKDLTNVQKVFRKMGNQLNSGMDPKLLVEYLGAEMKDLAAFGQKYGGSALTKVGKGITGIDLPIFQTLFASTYDIEQDSPLWLTLPAAFTDEVSNIFGLYEKSKGRFGLGKVKDFGKFVASSFVPQVVRSPIFKAVSKVGKIGSLAAPLTEAGVQAYRFEKMKERRDDAIRQFNLPIEIGNRAFDNYIRSTVPQDAFDELNVPASPGLPGIKRDIQQLGSIVGLADDPYAIQKVRGDVTGTGLTSPMALQRLYDRQGLDQGGPPDPKRRLILKALGLIPATIAGIASVRFGPQKVAKVAEAVKSVPPYFFKLVDKIKSFGDDVTKRFATDDLENVYNYRTSDADYELYENIATGDKRIKVIKGDPDAPGYKEEELILTKGQSDESAGIVPDEYDEYTVKSDFDGKMKDIEDGLDDIEDLIEEIGPDNISVQELQDMGYDVNRLGPVIKKKLGIE